LFDQWPNTLEPKVIMPPPHSDASLPVVPLSALLTGAVALGSSPILVRMSELEPTATAFYRVALAAPVFLLSSVPYGKPPAPSATPHAGLANLLWLTAAGAFF